MTDPVLALQVAIGERLATTPAVLDLVAASSIIDGPRRPETFPSIIFGAAQTVAEDVTFSRNHARVFQDLHVWTRDGQHVEAKRIVGAMVAALRDALNVEDISLVDFRFSGARYLRDPDDQYGHAVVAVEALVGWRS